MGHRILDARRTRCVLIKILFGAFFGSKTKGVVLQTKIILFSICFLGITVIGCADTKTAKDILRSKIDEYNQLVEKEIPQGSNADQVQSFLDAHKIEHSDYTSASDLKWDSAYEKLKYSNKQQNIKGYIQAMRRHVMHDLFVSWSIQFRFYFNVDKKLIAHTIDTIGTGS